MGHMTSRQTTECIFIQETGELSLLAGQETLTGVEECLAGIWFFLSNSVPLYTATKIPFIFFPEKELGRLSLNFHIHVFCERLYIPQIKSLVFLSNSPLHCNENPIYFFPEKKLRGLSPNFHIHVSVSDLYIPRIGPHIFLRRIGRPIVGIYKSLTDT
jgi:hypothetical protein